jgi:starvation-inducible DNA-binding protein
MKKNRIGLDKEISKKIAAELNSLLANFQIFYINVRGFHWNIKGDKFFELHLKFEELYTDTLLKIDEVAERILTIGYFPLHSFSDYLNTATIKERINISDGKEAISIVLAGYQELLEIERKLLRISASVNDEGTNALVSDYIRQQEKQVWMYTAYLN